MDRPQSFSNHRALPPPHYLAIATVLFLEACHRAWILVREPDWSNAWMLVVWACVFGAAFEARMRAMVVQDRLIRLEMTLRLERLLGSTRRAELRRILLPQLIALRFAGDAELPALVDEVLAGKLERPSEIKRRVREWQADWLRV